MYEEICGGMTEDAGTHLQKTFSVSDSGIVMEKQKLELLDEITCEEPLEREDDVALRVY